MKRNLRPLGRLIIRVSFMLLIIGSYQLLGQQKSKSVHKQKTSSNKTTIDLQSGIVVSIPLSVPLNELNSGKIDSPRFVGNAVKVRLNNGEQIDASATEEQMRYAFEGKRCSKLQKVNDKEWKVVSLDNLVSSDSIQNNIHDNDANIPKEPGIYYKFKNIYLKIPVCPTKYCEGITEEWLKIAEQTLVPSQNPIILFRSMNKVMNDSIVNSKSEGTIFSVARYDNEAIQCDDHGQEVIDSLIATFNYSYKCSFKPGLHIILRSSSKAAMIVALKSENGIRKFAALDNKYNSLGLATPLCVFYVNN